MEEEGERRGHFGLPTVILHVSNQLVSNNIFNTLSSIFAFESFQITKGELSWSDTIGGGGRKQPNFFVTPVKRKKGCGSGPRL
jgi:hypothetical protein